MWLGTILPLPPQLFQCKEIINQIIFNKIIQISLLNRHVCLWLTYCRLCPKPSNKINHLSNGLKNKFSYENRGQIWSTIALEKNIHCGKCYSILLMIKFRLNISYEKKNIFNFLIFVHFSLHISYCNYWVSIWTMILRTAIYIFFVFKGIKWQPAIIYVPKEDYFVDFT